MEETLQKGSVRIQLSRQDSQLTLPSQKTIQSPRLPFSLFIPLPTPLYPVSTLNKAKLAQRAADGCFPEDDSKAGMRTMIPVLMGIGLNAANLPAPLSAAEHEDTAFTFILSPAFLLSAPSCKPGRLRLLLTVSRTAFMPGRPGKAGSGLGIVPEQQGRTLTG